MTGKFTVELNGEKINEFENEIFDYGIEAEIEVDFKEVTEEYYKHFIPYREYIPPHPDPEIKAEEKWQTHLLNHSLMSG
jgi:hypothetical protein